MRLVTLLAEVDTEKCTGCRTCQKVCPTLAIKVENRKAVVDSEKCRGCNNCEQRCPVYAIKMVKRVNPVRVYVDPSTVDRSEVEALCKKARFNPEQIICYCTETRAEEVAAAILKGADTPEKLSLETGIRTGCKVECIQPILRLLEAAGITPERPDGYQWYGRTPTVWDIPEEIKEKYSHRGFYFDQDIKVLNKVAEGKKSLEEAR
ncbi:(2Fe-2S)-binding protein [Fonticella tunisiensis]|uniref:BFD-like [2Fe-2S] binding protein n=1 Tax=Fonticella tunisiensis TaxID=1096341 RepID=A0A4R7KAU1_9CLOT|nr:(2Fe-2S)-binding protein [Fonticella tunisiensis]TDT51032.1 BFD-like [2Fe-2S] binding protein [Fonticella tunisiensis]